MAAYAIGVGVCYARSLFDWKGGLFFEVPLIIFSRVLWNSIKVGKDGVEFTETPSEALRNAEQVTAQYLAAAEADDSRNVGAAVVSQGGASLSLIASGSQSAELLKAETDPLLAMARLRIDIERELRRTAILAGLIPRDKILPISSILTELTRHELIPFDSARALRSVIDVANRALHGRVDIPTDSSIARVGAEIIRNIQELALTESWLTKVLSVRARANNLSVELNVRPAGADRRIADIKIGNTLFEVKRVTSSGTVAAIQDYDILVVCERPSLDSIERATASHFALAWPSGDVFLGTPSVTEVAPWLLD